MMRPGLFEKAWAKTRLLMQHLFSDPKTRIPCAGCGRWSTLRMLTNRHGCPACGRPYGPQPVLHQTQEMARRQQRPLSGLAPMRVMHLAGMPLGVRPWQERFISGAAAPSR